MLRRFLTNLLRRRPGPAPYLADDVRRTLHPEAYGDVPRLPAELSSAESAAIRREVERQLAEVEVCGGEGVFEMPTDRLGVFAARHPGSSEEPS